MLSDNSVMAAIIILFGCNSHNYQLEIAMTSNMLSESSNLDTEYRVYKRNISNPGQPDWLGGGVVPVVNDT